MTVVAETDERQAGDDDGMWTFYTISVHSSHDNDSPYLLVVSKSSSTVDQFFVCQKWVPLHGCQEEHGHRCFVARHMDGMEALQVHKCECSHGYVRIRDDTSSSQLWNVRWTDSRINERKWRSERSNTELDRKISNSISCCYCCWLLLLLLLVSSKQLETGRKPKGFYSRAIDTPPGMPCTSWASCTRVQRGQKQKSTRSPIVEPAIPFCSRILPRIFMAAMMLAMGQM